MDAFDADVLIYAAAPGHPLGRRIAALFAPAPRAESDAAVGIGSVLLVPELLTKPTRDGASEEVAALAALLARLDLLPVDSATAELAAALGAAYSLAAADAVHLATAVSMGAERFLTTNSKDFPKTIAEVEIIYPSDLR